MYGEDVYPDNNPKTVAGAQKPTILSVIPTAALLELGQVMALGASKYGPYNWREKPISTSVYVDAAMRHLVSFWDGETIDPESGAMHAAHVIACMAILIDAYHQGILNDNRPARGRSAEMISEFAKHGSFHFDPYDISLKSRN